MNAERGCGQCFVRAFVAITTPTIWHALLMAPNEKQDLQSFQLTTL